MSDISDSGHHPSSDRRGAIAALRAELAALFNEDPVNLESALDRLDRLEGAAGPDLHAGLLQLLLNLAVDEEEARRLWESFRAHRARMEEALARPVALRVAALDWLIEQNRASSHPRRLEVIQTHDTPASVMIDPVTGLHTAGFMADLLPREIGRASRFDLELALLHLEIDDYASLVERLGPTVGTLLLAQVGALVAGGVRSIDFAARMSAARFWVLLTETDRMGACYLGERLRRQVEQLYPERGAEGRPSAVTISVGVACFPEDADSAEQLALRAQEAWFTARTRGRGRVAVHPRDRREFIRLKASHEDLEVTLLPEGTEETAQGSVRNISCRGILFESRTPIELDRAVHVLCRSRRESDQVLIPGRVVRSGPLADDGSSAWEIGVLFDLVVEEQMEGMVDFLERFVAAEPTGSGGPGGDARRQRRASDSAGPA